MPDKENETDAKTQLSSSMTLPEPILEETLDTLNTVDECNKLLIESMKSLSVETNPEDTKHLCNCAKEIRGLLKLKLEAAKFLRSELAKNK
jgi:RNA processing factor Prp31